MGNDLKHLELRHRTYYARVTIPPSMRGHFNGSQRLYRSLKTGELREAQERRHQVVAELKDEIKARRGAIAAKKSYAFTPEALQIGSKFRQRIEIAENVGDYDRAALISVEALRSEEQFKEKPNGEFVAQTMWAVATGAVAIVEHVETWLVEMKFKERSKADRRLAVRELHAWLASKGLSGTIHTIDSRVAGDFRLQALKGMHPRTANKRLESLRSYWRWLIGVGHVEENPWVGKSIPKRATLNEQPERPFTDDEVARLFSGHATWQMRDVMAIGALSGMRLDEIFQLTVADCENGIFNIRKAKTSSGIRVTPIHPALVSIVKRRTTGKTAGEYLIEEGSDSGWDGNRSMAFSKRFGTYRRSCGVDDVRAGNARSRVNYHSFRRWFITKADQAGLREQDVARLVGHKLKSMSYGLYSGGPGIDQLRKVVESVELPNGVVADAVAMGEQMKVIPKLRRKKSALRRKVC